MRHADVIERLQRIRQFYRDTIEDYTAVEAIDKAISALEKQEAIKSCTPPSDDWEHYADRLHDIAYQSGYEQGKKEAEQDRWIPVTERLPKTSGLYTVTDMTGNVVRYVFTGTDSSKRYWKRNAVAWRPLPEAYTEEEA